MIDFGVGVNFSFGVGFGVCFGAGFGFGGGVDFAFCVGFSFGDGEAVRMRRVLGRWVAAGGVDTTNDSVRWEDGDRSDGTSARIFCVRI